MPNREPNQIPSTNHTFLRCVMAILALAAASGSLRAQIPPTPRAKAVPAKKMPVAPPRKALARPKLVVLLVVDQMRGDYVDKFLPQWTGGLRRLVEEGAWFRDAAYPYAATETCVGHHGM